MSSELLEGMLLQILDIASIYPTSFFDDVTATLDSYQHGAVLSTVNNIMSGTVFATGQSLLTLFMLLEMVALVNRYNSDGGMSAVRLPTNMMIKFGVYAFLYCNLGKVMIGIQAFVSKIATSVDGYRITIDTSALQTITSTFSSMDILEKLCAFVLILIVFCITQVIMIIIQTVVSFRIFELFLVYMFAPIPLATLASQEFRHVAFNYLKNFTALCLQSAIILGAFKLYNIIIVHSIPTTVAAGSSSWDIFQKILMPIAGYLVVLATAVMNSGRISRSIVNAM